MFKPRWIGSGNQREGSRNLNETEPLPAEALEFSASVVGLMATAAVLSFAAGFYLFQRHVGGQPLLHFEPRRRAPWGPLVLCIPLTILFVSVAGLFVGDSDSAAPSSDEFVWGATLFSFAQVLFVFVAMIWLRWDRAADLRDLGLPESFGQFCLDALRGTVACLAILMPALLVKFILSQFVQTDQQHPLIEQILSEASPLLLLVGGFSAVVAAPVFEEFTFRVLLQGWLEAVEDRRLGYSETARESPSSSEESDDPNEKGDGAEAVVVNEDASRANVQQPVPGLLPDLPRGWLPILLSGTLFGLAHIGHGVSFVPLILFGIVLGYLYQRTHRLAPCVIAHMLFNSYSMIVLWLSLTEK